MKNKKLPISILFTVIGTPILVFPTVLVSCSQNNGIMIINSITSSKTGNTYKIYISGSKLSNNIGDYQILAKDIKIPIGTWNFDEKPNPNSVVLRSNSPDVLNNKLELRLMNKNVNISINIPNFQESKIISLNGSYNYDTQMINIKLIGNNLPNIPEKWNILMNGNAISKEKFSIKTIDNKNWDINVFYARNENILNQSYSLDIDGNLSKSFNLNSEKMNSKIKKMNGNMDSNGIVSIYIEGDKLYEQKELWKINNVFKELHIKKIKNGILINFINNGQTKFSLTYNNEITREVKLTEVAFEKGGIYNGLTIDKYLSIVMLLELKYETSLSSLTNDIILNKKNKNPDYNSINLELAEGSDESIGVLKLKIYGRYKNQQIKEQTITIDGFLTKSNFQPLISSINFKKEIYFKDFQTTENMKRWNFDLWKKYASIDLFANREQPKILNLESLVQNKSIKISSVIFNGNTLTLNTLSPNKKYVGKEWIGKEIPNNIKFDVTTLTESDALDYIIKNKVQITNKKEEYINKRFASYYYANVNQINSGRELLNLFTIEDKKQFENTYFNKNEITFNETNKNDLSVDDYNGELGVTLYLTKLEEHNNSKIHNKRFNITGFKTIPQFIENIPSSNSQIQITTKSKKYYQIIKEIRKKYKTWNDIPNNQISSDTINISQIIFNNQYNDNQLAIYRSNIYDNDSNVQSNFPLFDKKNIYSSILFLNKDISSTNFDPSTRLFIGNGNNDNFGYGFVIDTINFSFKNNYPIKISKFDNIVTITFSGEYNFSDLNNSYNTEAEMFLTIHEKDFK